MIHIPEHKYPQHILKIEEFLTPSKLYLPLIQHTGKPSIPCVGINTMVKETELIGENDGFISAKLHAPTAGKIISLDQGFHPLLKRTPTITIACEYPDIKKYPLQDNLKLEKENLINLIQNAGIVGMGGACFPTHVKLSSPKMIETLIVNGCECEPYLACDCRLMIEKTNEIFKGLEVVKKIIAPKEIIFAIEDNKPLAIKKIKRYLAINKKECVQTKLHVLKSTYPQGGEKQLIFSVKKKKVPGGKLPFDLGCLVQNVSTLIAIHNAIYYRKPLTERLVTFAGDALESPKNIWLKIGTSLEELLRQGILHFKKDPKKIICGGPMMGLAIDNLKYPIMKGTSGFLFLTDNIDESNQKQCIKCGRCVDVCPMNLVPLEYVKYVDSYEYMKLPGLNISDCIECASCTYICPAKIPIVQYIKLGKKYATTNK